MKTEGEWLHELEFEGVIGNWPDVLAAIRAEAVAEERCRLADLLTKGANEYFAHRMNDQGAMFLLAANLIANATPG